MNKSQKRAIKNYRNRLSERGLSRFEVLGRNVDRDLIRTLARKLADAGPDAARIRAALSQTVADDQPERGNILAALRRSPLVNTELDLVRAKEAGRKVNL
jgi:hypothetical protein